MSRVERSAGAADSVFDALAQAALDHGSPEEAISVSSEEPAPGIVVYHVHLESSRNGAAEFDPAAVTEKESLELVALLVEQGATILTYRTKQ